MLTKSLFSTHSVDNIAGSLQTSVGKVKKLINKNNIPYLKVGHQWRLEQESYEQLMEKLTCHSFSIDDQTVSIGGSRVEYTTQTNISQFDKAQNVLRNEMQRK